MSDNASPVAPLRHTFFAGAEGLQLRHPELFRPNWRRRLAVTGTAAFLLGLAALAVVTLDVSWSRVWSGMSRLGEFAELMLPPSFGTWSRLDYYVVSMAQTLAIAFLGTLIGAILAFPFGFLAARNVVANPVAHFAVRRLLDVIRSIDQLIWALIWINVVGLGPFAGILAIMTEDIGEFGKLFSETIEAADRRPVEGILSTGGGRWSAVRFGLLPQVLPVFLSQVLYYFESNVRRSTIIGIVGAGGIGQAFAEAIQELEWQRVAFLTIMILVAVAVIDHLSARLRFAVIGARSRTA